MSLFGRVLLILCFLNSAVYATDPIEISILTCSPGNQVYSVFGHSSIRVKTEGRSDLVYNFGMFDFNTPNFSYKFLKGKLKYFLGIQQTDDFIRIYTKEGRTVSEQVLTLSENEKKEIIDKLQFLYRPENRFYYYSFLYKDCSTELRDLLADIGVAFREQKLEETYREMITAYLQDSQWLRLGVNIISGTALDTHTDSYSGMFLPEYLRTETALASINGEELVESENLLNSIQTTEKQPYKKLASPLIVFSILAVVLIFRLPNGVKMIISALVGMTGLLLLILWIFSEHPELRNNFNLLWCNPLYLLYIPLIIRRRSSQVLSLVLILCLVITIILWIIQIQSFDIAVAPIMAVMLLINYSGLKEIRFRRISRPEQVF